MSNLALYEIAAQYRDMAAKLADLDLDDQTIADTLEGESGALVEKGTTLAVPEFTTYLERVMQYAAEELGVELCTA